MIETKFPRREGCQNKKNLNNADKFMERYKNDRYSKHLKIRDKCMAICRSMYCMGKGHMFVFYP